MIELVAGDLRVMLDPETGGAIAAFTWRDVALLRPVSDPRLGAQHERAVAGYPLIPFANRVADGRFSFGGSAYRLARNFGGDPNPIHGNAWMHPWTVGEVGRAHARVALDFTPDGDLAGQWPFAYQAEQTYELHDDCLRISMTVRNTDTRAFPAGIGLHPYVARTSQSRLRFRADTMWLTGADGLPTLREAVHGAQDFAQERTIDSAEIDTCYANWGGEASMTQPGVTLTVSAGAPMGHLQLYTPTGRDFIGLEPVSNMPDAINRMNDVADHGLVVLRHGELLRGEVLFEVRQAVLF